METRGGLAGILERFFITRFLRKTYRREMKNLADAAVRS
jgi:hypothetical protein